METGEGRKEAETRALIPFFFSFFLRPVSLIVFLASARGLWSYSLALSQTESHWSVL